MSGTEASDVSERRLATDAALGLGVFLIASWFAWTWGWQLADDAWLMQVTNRFLSGEVLYRDVYLHVTPLSVYLLALPAALLGPQILILRTEIALVFAATAILVCRINEQLGGRRYSVVLILSLIVFASPARLALVTHYNIVANFFFLLAFSLWLSWLGTQRVNHMWAAGAALGACFAAKQTWGFYGAIALAISTLSVARVEHWSLLRAFQLLVRAAAAFVVVALIAILPAIVRGGLPDMISIAVFGRHTYLSVGGMPYWKPLLSLKSILENPFSLDSLRYVNAALPFLIPFVAEALFVAKLLRDDTRERALTIAVAAFTIATLAFLYPRADPEHMLFATPMLVIALAFAWRSVRLSQQSIATRVIETATVAFTAVAAVVMTWSAINRATSPDYVSSTLPDFRGPLLPRDIHEGFKRNLVSVAALPHDGRTFFLGPYASFYYLAGGLHDPTRYDYPYVVALGQSGVAEIISKIRAGKISTVCLDQNGDPQLKAYALMKYVEQNMIRVPVPDFCEQYVRHR